MKTCFKCKQEIEEKENHCTLISFSNGEKSNEDSWHATCWKEYWEEKMDNRVKLYAEAIKKQAMPLIKAKFGDVGDMPSILA